MAARKAAPRARKPAGRKLPPRLPPLPPESGEAPLHDLSRDQLSVFLYLALLPEETAALVRERLRWPSVEVPQRGDCVSIA